MPPDFGRSGCLVNKTKESGLQLLRWMLCVLIFPRNSWLTLLFSKWLLSENISRGCRNHVLRGALISSVLGCHCVRKSFQRRRSLPLLLREKTAGEEGLLGRQRVVQFLVNSNLNTKKKQIKPGFL